MAVQTCGNRSRRRGLRTTLTIDPEYEQVLFRHADPNSLIRVLQVLTDEQRMEFIAEARGVLLEYVDHFGNIELVRRPRDGRLLFGAAPAVGQPAEGAAPPIA